MKHFISIGSILNIEIRNVDGDMNEKILIVDDEKEIADLIEV